MPKLIRCSILIMGLLLPTWSLATESPADPNQAKSSVLGEVVKIDDSIFTVKDQSGKELQLKIDQRTTQVGMFHQGTHVRAWVLPDGRTESIIEFRTTERDPSPKP
jgi:hypothetical protein